MSKTASETAVCPYCGAPAGDDDVVYQNSEDDPLMVAECGACDRVISVESHPW